MIVFVCTNCLPRFKVFSDVFFCDFVAISFPCVMRNTVVVV